MSESPVNSQANFNDMKTAGVEFQNALERCQEIQGKVDVTKGSLSTVYTGDSSAPVFFAKFALWQQDFDVVRGALARMTLELADATVDYQKQEDLNKEIADAIAVQLGP